MTHIETQLRNAIVMLKNYASADADRDDAAYAREQIAKMEAALPDYTRAGNLSPEYQRRVDEFNRQEARNV